MVTIAKLRRIAFQYTEHSSSSSSSRGGYDRCSTVLARQNTDGWRSKVPHESLGGYCYCGLYTLPLNYYEQLVEFALKVQ